MNSAVIKPEGDSYATSDQMMCEVLLMAGHSAEQVQAGSDGHLTYVFPKEAVWPTVEAILTGKADTLHFSYADWWKARTTWQMNLRHMSQARRSR